MFSTGLGGKHVPVHKVVGSLLRLRTYPPAFAKKLARLHTRFCSKRTLWFGTHLEVDNWELSVHLFEELPWEEADWWPDAAMESVFCYLRGSKDLELGSLRRLFPTHLP